MTPSQPKAPPKPEAKAVKPASTGINLTPKRLRWVLLGLLGLLALLFLVIASVGLGKISQKSQALVAVKLKSRTADAQLTSLEVAKTQVEKYGYFNNVASTVLPSDKDQAQAVLDIYRLANKSGISIGSITFPASTLGATSSVSATGTSSTVNAISQAKPVEGIKGLYSLNLTITPQQPGPGVPASKTATYPKFLDFLKKIEHDRRTAQITQINIEPQDSKSGPTQAINFSLSINIFIRPSSK